MSPGVPRKNRDDDAEPAAAVPVAADRPFVDGTEKSPEEIRAEVEVLSEERLQDVEELRADLGDTVEELAARLDVPARVRTTRDETVATVQQQGDRARRALADKAAVVGSTARERPGVLAGAAAVVVLVLVVLRRRRSVSR